MDELQEILNEFVDEATEVLGNVMVDLMDLENGHDDEVVNRVYRAFHSVKGNAGMLGMERLSAFAHKAEDVLSLVRERRLEPDKELVSLLLRAVDAMTAILEDARCGGGDGRDVSELAQQLAAVVERVGPPKGKKRSPSAVELECRMSEKMLEKEPSETVPEPSVAASPKKAPVPLAPQEPRPEPQPQRPLRPRETSQPKRPARNGSGPLHILVVEDDFFARQILMNFLTQFGVCHVAKDGLEAIHAFIQAHEACQAYDLICMDIKMPVMDGLLAVRTMREIERGKGIEGTSEEAAIVITSSVEDPVAIIKACYECGANYYFLKPLDMDQVRRQLFKLGLVALPSEG
jgi:two-component system chemotaxis response regulator CheY